MIRSALNVRVDQPIRARVPLVPNSDAVVAERASDTAWTYSQATIQPRALIRAVDADFYAALLP